MSTGSAPISSDVFEFLRVCFGATVSEGYGMTETACTIAMTRPDDATIGHVGAPIECCEIKLEDIPDMNYKNTDQPYPRGEVDPPAPFLHCLCLKLLLKSCMTCMDTWSDGPQEVQLLLHIIQSPVRLLVSVYLSWQIQWLIGHILAANPGRHYTCSVDQGEAHLRASIRIQGVIGPCKLQPSALANCLLPDCPGAQFVWNSSASFPTSLQLLLMHL